MSERRDRWTAAGALLVYAGLCTACRERPRGAELRLFRRVNALPEQPWHRFPQQLGTPWARPWTGSPPPTSWPGGTRAR